MTVDMFFLFFKIIVILIAGPVALAGFLKGINGQTGTENVWYND